MQAHDRLHLHKMMSPIEWTDSVKTPDSRWMMRKPRNFMAKSMKMRKTMARMR